MTFNWQLPDWPHFRYDSKAVEADLLRFADQAGQVSGLLKGVDASNRTDAVVQLMVAEAMKTSAIEGEVLSRPDVMSSVRYRLGLMEAPPPTTDRASAGAGELMVMVRHSWNEDLNQETLFTWHRTLMQADRRVLVGAWRRHAEPMQVVSGAVGKTKLHFEAPPSARVPAEMERFIAWFNASRHTVAAPPVRAAITHLYFSSSRSFTRTCLA